MTETRESYREGLQKFSTEIAAVNWDWGYVGIEGKERIGFEAADACL